MADLKACKKYADCGWRRSVGYCPENCNHFKHKDEVIVIRCKNCKHYRNHPNGLCYANAEEKPRGVEGVRCVEPEDFCSYGERKDNG